MTLYYIGRLIKYLFSITISLVFYKLDFSLFLRCIELNDLRIFHHECLLNIKIYVIKIFRDFSYLSPSEIFPSFSFLFHLGLIRFPSHLNFFFLLVFFYFILCSFFFLIIVSIFVL